MRPPRPAEPTASPSTGQPRPDASTPTAAAALTRALDGIGFNRAHRLILAMVLLGAFFDVMEEDALGAVGPSLKNAWGISTAALALLQTVTIAAMIGGKIMTGVLGDLRGRRFVLTFNLAIYCAGALVCALAPNYGVLAAGRFVVGIGLGGEIAAGLTILSELVATRHRGAAVASLNVGAGGFGNMVAFGFAAVVLGPLTGFFGGPGSSWRWMFGLLVIPAVLVLFYRRYLPETPRYLLSRGKVDDANRVLTVLASGRLHSGPDNPTEFIPREVAADMRPEKVRLVDVFRGGLFRRTAALTVASWMTFGAQISVLILMPVILVDRGYGITQSLVFTMVMNVGSLLGAAVASFCAYRWPRRLVMTVGSGLAFAAALLFGLAAHGAGTILLFGGLFQFCVLLLNSTIFAWSPELYPTRVRAFGTSVIALQGNVAGALLPIGAGFLLDHSGTKAMFVAIAVMFVILTIAVRLAPETHGRPLEDINAQL